MLLLILIIIILYMKFMQRTPMPIGVQLYFAGIGSGKTTLLSKIIYQLKKPPLFNFFPFKKKPRYKNILSNALIDGCYYTSDYRTLAKAIMVENTAIIIDEGSIEYNNRLATDKTKGLTQKEIENLKLIRHFQSCLIIVSQDYSDIDITIRRLYTHIFLLEYLPFGFSLIKQIKKRIDIDKETGQITEKYHFVIPPLYRLLWRPKYFKFFNSWWIPEGSVILNFDDPEQLKKYKIVKMKDIDYRKFKRFKGFMSEKKLITFLDGKKQKHIADITALYKKEIL